MEDGRVREQGKRLGAGESVGENKHILFRRQ